MSSLTFQGAPGLFRGQEFLNAEPLLTMAHERSLSCLDSGKKSTAYILETLHSTRLLSALRFLLQMLLGSRQAPLSSFRPHQLSVQVRLTPDPEQRFQHHDQALLHQATRAQLNGMNLWQLSKLSQVRQPSKHQLGPSVAYRLTTLEQLGLAI